MRTKTKADYEEIVEIIRSFKGLCEEYNSGSFYDIVISIADDLGRRNTNFKRDKFLGAVFK